jgi:RNA polymerase sigma-70 factor (ECF subfamily)
MADTRADLRRLLVARYDELARHLKRNTGSAELAEDALQDTWVRLGQGAPLPPARNPSSYLTRATFNVARDRIRAERRHRFDGSLDEALAQIDEAPGPGEIVEARSELAALRAVLATLPARRRRIFEMAWGEGIHHAEIAAHFGLTVRSVNIELARAREACAEHLKRNGEAHFPNASADSSHE